MNALAIRPVAPPVAPLGLCADLVQIEMVLAALEQGAGADRELDAAIYEALGWEVSRGAQARRRLPWRCRSPLSTGWGLLPSPTDDMRAAARLVPWRWDWGCGVAGGHARGWCRDWRERPGALPRYAEQTRATPARALTSAALHARRQIVMGGGHG